MYNSATYDTLLYNGGVSVADAPSTVGREHTVFRSDSYANGPDPSRSRSRANGPDPKRANRRES